MQKAKISSECMQVRVRSLPLEWRKRKWSCSALISSQKKVAAEKAKRPNEWTDREEEKKKQASKCLSFSFSNYIYVNVNALSVNLDMRCGIACMIPVAPPNDPNKHEIIRRMGHSESPTGTGQRDAQTAKRISCLFATTLFFYGSFSDGKANAHGVV